MIRFFRSIRQGLINEGKTSKYFRYAVGEILLVVIGILIALQVNNWNIERAEAELEQEYIQRLIEDIERDMELFGLLVGIAEVKLEFAQLLKDAVIDTEVALTRPSEFVYAGRSAHGIRSAKSSNDTFDELRSTGYLRLLKDNQLKSLLFDYYRYDDDRRNNDPMHQMSLQIH